jgi:hypothetical protein
MRKVTTGLLMIAFLSGPAIAGDQTKDKKGNPEKVVCKADKSTGSAISERICKTRAQWDEEKFQAREIMDDRGRVGQQQRAAGGGGG